MSIFSLLHVSNGVSGFLYLIGDQNCYHIINLPAVAVISRR